EAEIGTVLVGPETRRQLGDSMRWGPPQPFELKGKRGVVEGAIALGSRGRTTDLDPPLVGRTDEMQAIAGVIEDLTRGTGRTLVLVGEAGIGKRRLLAEARRLARDANVAWLDGQCSALEEGTPFAAFRGLLRSSASLVDVGGEPASILRRLMDGETTGEEVDRTPDEARCGVVDAMAGLQAELRAWGDPACC